MGPIATRLAQALARIASQDQHWHAMLALNPQAQTIAAELDEHTPTGPLFGKILAIKDNIDLAGMATSSGCKALAQAMPLGDADVVARLKAAGMVVIGKANLSELSFEIRSRSSMGGDVLCPFAPHATAGGSSGGSAVAVALGFADMALGTDTGGSIRIPAACNGLVGLRPAHGALPMAGIAPLAPATDTVGPITRNLADAKALYRAMGGQLGPLGPVKGMRLGLLHQAYGEDPAILAAMALAEQRLAAAGVELVPLTLEGIEDHLAGPHIVDAQFAASFDAYLASNFHEQTAPASLSELVASGQFLPEHSASLRRRMRRPPDAAPILAAHRRLASQLELAMAQLGLDGLLYPSLRVIPQDLDNPKGGWAAELAARTGWPAISVPALGRPALPPCPDQPSPDQPRPVGAEILVPAGEEAKLFALAAIICEEQL